MEGKIGLCSPTDNRKHPRIEVRWPITVLTHNGKVQGETSNIGVEGISICTDTPLPPNEAFFMSIRPPHHHAVKLAGKVVWSSLYGIDDQKKVFAIGICFVKIIDRDRKLLAGLVASQLDNQDE